MKSLIFFFVILGALIALGHFIKSGRKVNIPNLTGFWGGLSMRAVKEINWKKVSSVLVVIALFVWAYDHYPAFFAARWQEIWNLNGSNQFLLVAIIVLLIAHSSSVLGAVYNILGLIVIGLIVFWLWGKFFSNSNPGTGGTKPALIVLKKWGPGIPTRIDTLSLPYSDSLNCSFKVKVLEGEVMVDAPGWGEPFVLKSSQNWATNFPEKRYFGLVEFQALK